jgi:hypothetical protein
MKRGPVEQPLPKLDALVEAAKATGIPYSTLRLAAADQEFPTVRIGKGEKRSAIYVRRDDFLQWLDRRTTGRREA